MSKTLHLGTDDYFADNPDRIAIYNSNYAESGEKISSDTFCWFVSRNYKHWGGGFPSQEDATDYLREQLTNANAQVSE